MSEDSTKKGGSGHDDQKDKKVCLIIKTTQGTWTEKFEKTDKVSDVITAVIKHFNFAPNGNYKLRLTSNPHEDLKPERTLVSYGFSAECQEVVFTDLGNAA